METSYLSLLFPAETRGMLGHALLPESTIEDLNLKALCRCFAPEEESRKTVLSILSDCVYDADTIAYRQEIFEDFLHVPGLCEALADARVKLKTLDYNNQTNRHVEEAKLWFLFNRFKELESYVDCIEAIEKSLSSFGLSSRGLRQVRDTFHQLTEDEEFARLSKIVKGIAIDMDQIHSLTIGVNLDPSLNPSEVTLVSVNPGVYKENGFVRAVFGALPIGKQDDLRTPTKLHRPTRDKRDPILYNLYRDIERLLDPLISDLSDKLARFTHIRTQHVLSLIPEIEFYLCGVRLVRDMEKAGLSMCRAQILPITERKSELDGMFNLHLAYDMLSRGENAKESLVLNCVRFDDDGRILIITGPNRGGKTVYTEAIGYAHILFQAGFYVPAKSARMSPADGIYTHFPADENKTVTLGRLGEESSRISGIFKSANEHSLILLNESLTSTSYSEGLYLAKCVVKAMRYMGLRAVYNTHIHELAQAAQELNDSIEGESRIVSLISGMENGARSFVIKPGAPLGSSYAMDIAGKFGLDLPQLMEVIDCKKEIRRQMNAVRKEE